MLIATGNQLQQCTINNMFLQSTSISTGDKISGLPGAEHRAHMTTFIHPGVHITHAFVCGICFQTSPVGVIFNFPSTAVCRSADSLLCCPVALQAAVLWLEDGVPASSRRRLVRHVRGCGFFFARLGSYPRHSRAFDRNPLHRSALSQGQYSVLSTLGRLPAGEPSIGLARLSQPHGPTPVVRGHTTLRDIYTCIVLWGGVVWCGVENLRRKAAAVLCLLCIVLYTTRYEAALDTLVHQYPVTAVCTYVLVFGVNRQTD